MRLIIKGSSKKIVSLSKELKLRTKRDGLEMVIQKTKTEESQERELQENLVKADEKAETIKKSNAKKAEAEKVKEIKKVESEKIADIEAKGDVKARQEEQTRIAEKAKAEKKAEEEKLQEENEKALEYVKSKMQKAAGITSESPKKTRVKAKQD